MLISFNVLRLRPPRLADSHGGQAAGPPDLWRFGFPEMSGLNVNRFYGISFNEKSGVFSLKAAGIKKPKGGR